MINSKGQIVGQSFSCDTGTARAVLWEEGAIIDLNTLVPANTNLSLADAFNINEREEILCLCLPPGVNVTLILQLASDGRLPMQLFVSAKLLVAETLPMFSATVP